MLILDVEVWSPATLSKLNANKTPLPLTKLVFSMLPLQFMVSYVEYFGVYIIYLPEACPTKSTCPTTCQGSSRKSEVG